MSFECLLYIVPLPPSHGVFGRDFWFFEFFVIFQLCYVQIAYGVVTIPRGGLFRVVLALPYSLEALCAEVHTFGFRWASGCFPTP